MNHKESPTPNPSPNPREDDDRKEEANRRVAEYSRAMTETSRASDEERREQVERERIAANTPLQFEERVVTVDGPHDFISVKFPLRDESGRPYAICGIATDITEFKKVEAEREQLLVRERAKRPRTWLAPRTNFSPSFRMSCARL